ncbi:unnamed protein product, partial [Iphiclides podalirius]
MCASERGDMESPGEETGRGAPPASHTPAAAQPNGSNKIIGRNVNGTTADGPEPVLGYESALRVSDDKPLGHCRTNSVVYGRGATTLLARFSSFPPNR